MTDLPDDGGPWWTSAENDHGKFARGEVGLVV
jgi:hypothetical protein